MNKLRAAGYRSENALNMFLVARFLLPFCFFALAIFWVFGLDNLVDKPTPIRFLATLCLRCRLLRTEHLHLQQDEEAAAFDQARLAGRWT